MTDDDIGPRPKDWLMVISALFVQAKMAAVRGQPVNNGDVAECVDLAEQLIKEVARRTQ